jgi:hypothetical protein
MRFENNCKLAMLVISGRPLVYLLLVNFKVFWGDNYGIYMVALFSTNIF